MTQPATELKPGDKMPDGTVYAGISPDTKQPMYAMPADEGTTHVFCAGISPDDGKPMLAMGTSTAVTFTFNEARKVAMGDATLKAYGHDDWRLPTKNELNVLFNNRAAIGGFDTGGSEYWASSQIAEWYARCQCFSNGLQGGNYIDNRSLVRLVRTDARRGTHRAVHPKAT